MALTRREFLGLASAGMVGGAGVGLSGWHSGAGLPEVHEYSLRFGGLPPGLEGLRLLLVSDVHAGAFMDEARMRDIAGLASRLEPELVLLGGDMIDASGSSSDIGSFVRAFSELEPPLGVIAVPGNHDHSAGLDRIAEAWRAMDITLLRGDHQVVERGEGRLIVLGLDDPGQRSFDPSQDDAVAEVCSHAPAQGFRILLSHRPRAFEAAARHGMSLTLSGHTHGGQIGLPWRDLTLVRLLTEYVRGHYERDGSHLIVSSGVGTGSMPFRVAVPPSVALLTIRGTGSSRTDQTPSPASESTR